MATHKALQDAAMQQQACRLVLKWVIAPLNRAGQYQTLLDQWLLPLAEVEAAETRGEVLGVIGKQYLHIGDYDTALTFLKQSLQIRQEIGDKSGEGSTLNNISSIYQARGDYDTALTLLKQSLQIQQEIGDRSGMCGTLFNMGHIHETNDERDEAIKLWLEVYSIAKPMHLAQALDALESLAGKLGQEGGLQYWENLASNPATITTPSRKKGLLPIHNRPLYRVLGWVLLGLLLFAVYEYGVR